MKSVPKGPLGQRVRYNIGGSHLRGSVEPNPAPGAAALVASRSSSTYHEISPGN